MKKINFTNFALCLLTLFAFQAQAQVYDGVAYNGNIPQVGAGGTVGAVTTIEFEHYDALSGNASGPGANFSNNSATMPTTGGGTYNDKQTTAPTNALRTGSFVQDANVGTSTGTVIEGVQGQEYTVYTVNVVTAGTYHLNVNYAHNGSNKFIQFFSHNPDGTPDQTIYNGSGIPLPATGSSTTYATSADLGSFSLSAGTLLIRFRSLSAGPRFDYFTLTLDAVLPVELISFNAKPTAEGNLLQWQTASEVQNEGFEVQRSINGERWETLDFVEGNGTTFETQNYTYYDNLPLNGMNYYRLKQMDFDGQFEYSEVVSAELDIDNQNKISLYPNPVQNELTISEGIGNITIFNALGQPIRQLINNDALTTINTSDLSKGVYILQLEKTNRLLVTKQFVK